VGKSRTELAWDIHNALSGRVHTDMQKRNRFYLTEKEISRVQSSARVGIVKILGREPCKCLYLRTHIGLGHWLCNGRYRERGGALQARKATILEKPSGDFLTFAASIP